MSKIATRESYGKALVQLGMEHDDVVVLDADLAAATKTGMFKKDFPQRFMDCGIAEANMTNVAAGLSTMGLVPFCSSFAMFSAGRAYEMVRNTIGYPHLNVKVCASHGGISVGEDGASHQMNEDFALMRAIPGMVVMCPADDTEAQQMVKAAYEYVGPVYIRFSRAASPVIFGDDYEFKIGKSTTVREGKDISIIANGLMVAEALEAAKQLEAEGIDAQVINMSTIKPLDEAAVLEAAKNTGVILTAEEHSIIGGLGEAVSSFLAENYPVSVKRVGVNDEFGHSGKADLLLKQFGLSADNIASKAKELVNSKKAA